MSLLLLCILFKWFSQAFIFITVLRDMQAILNAFSQLTDLSKVPHSTAERKPESEAQSPMFLLRVSVLNTFSGLSFFPTGVVEVPAFVTHGCQEDHSAGTQVLLNH